MAQKVFRDAVHNMITLQREADTPANNPVDWGDALLLDLIDTPEMQRLRRIKQLGLAAHIYPSAEHSRFSHALGVLHLAKRVLSALLHRQPELFTPPQALQVKVAALLHDVGHGPFSHVFEEIFSGGASHEAWGWRIISDPHGTLLPVIQRHCQRLGLDPESFMAGLRGLLDKDHTAPAQAVGRQIISSQLDADRMDYLLRDAHFTGVSYGHYDLEWLLHSLRVAPVAGTPRLCVDLSKGPAALESYIAARDHMYRQVYDHKTVRAFEMLLVHLFRTVEWLWRREGSLPAGTPVELSRYLEQVFYGTRPPPVAHYLALDDAVLTYAMGHWAELDPATPPQRELRWKSRMLRHRTPIYRRLMWRRWSGGDDTDAGVSDLIHDPQAAQALDAFYHAVGEETVTVQEPDGTLAELPIRLLVHVDRLERTPYAHLQYTPGRADPIYAVDGAGRVQAAEHASSHINFLGHSHRRLARVFVDPRAVETIRALTRERFHHPTLAVD